jgi:hypothetical protein
MMGRLAAHSLIESARSDTFAMFDALLRHAFEHDEPVPERVFGTPNEQAKYAVAKEAAVRGDVGIGALAEPDRAVPRAGDPSPAEIIRQGVTQLDNLKEIATRDMRALGFDDRVEPQFSRYVDTGSLERYLERVARDVDLGETSRPESQ